MHICDFLLVFNTNLILSLTASEALQIIGQICVVDWVVPLFNTLVHGEP